MRLGGEAEAAALSDLAHCMDSDDFAKVSRTLEKYRDHESSEVQVAHKALQGCRDMMLTVGGGYHDGDSAWAPSPSVASSVRNHLASSALRRGG
eukprot:COSAG01_NODE_7789_length_3056_cov_12.767332_1_plen_94_part_00